jgi:hypothetical protein
MRSRLPPNVERNVVKGYVYYTYRVGKGPRIKLPDPSSEAFGPAYQAAMTGAVQTKPAPKQDTPRSLGALIASYYDSEEFAALRASSKDGYRRRLELMREAHGHRAVAGLTRERIEAKILKPLANKPGAKLDTLKKLRILIRHAKALKWLTTNPSEGIKRGKSKEIRAWTDAEMAAFETRWPYGTRQRASYEMMLNVGTARADTHLTTWVQAERELFEYTRRKTSVHVTVSQADSLRKALAALPRQHVTILVTEWGKPFTVDGFSGWMRDAMTAAGLPLDCKPHGLRKTLGRLLADAGATAHEIMAALGHMTLGEAERYTREADRRRGGKRALIKLEDHKANRIPQTPSAGLGKQEKS